MENYNGHMRRSRNKVIGGVCGGIAEKLGIDPVVVRLVFALLFFVGGGGLLVYIVLWIVLPEAPWEMPGSYDQSSQGADAATGTAGAEAYDKGVPARNSQTQLIVGLILIVLGALFLIGAFIPGFNAHDLWPVALIIIGLFLLKPFSNKQ